MKIAQLPAVDLRWKGVLRVRRRSVGLVATLVAGLAAAVAVGAVGIARAREVLAGAGLLGWLAGGWTATPPPPAPVTWACSRSAGWGGAAGADAGGSPTHTS